jgi:GNAT superfamily N-acetyltransferase
MGRKMRASKTSAVQIRPARPQDVPRLCEFAEELLHKWDARTTARDAQRVYEQILKSPELGVILVAENEGTLCGFTYACHEWRSEYGGETMDLVELFVEHSWRNRGVGRSLLDRLIEHARSRGIRRFTSQVHPGNAAIERALETCGFDPERRTLWALHL